MPVRMINKEELLECQKIQSVAFVSSQDTAQLQKTIEGEPFPADPYIGYFNEEGVLTACMELPEYRVRYEGNWTAMVGLGGVASLPEYRFGGAVRQIITAAFSRMRAGGAVFSCLYPFSHRYYRQFGYELCQTSAEYTLPVEALHKFRYTGKARMIKPGDPLDGLKAVFDAHFLRYNLAVGREDRHWKKIIGENPYKERVYTYLLEDESGPCAYLTLAAEDAGGERKTGVLREIAFVSPQGFSDALGFLYRLSAQYGTLRIPLPGDIPLAAVIDESHELKIDYYNQQMTRVVNLQKALELKNHFDGAAYTLRVHDHLIPENDGVFSVRRRGNTVSVERRPEGESPDLSADVRTMAQLLLGYLSLEQAAYRPDLIINGNLETLRRVFTRRETYLTDHF